MHPYYSESVNEQKLDQISKHLEDFILDAFLSVLQKLKHRKDVVSHAIERQRSDEMKF
jgi:hypothetical protein